MSETSLFYRYRLHVLLGVMIFLAALVLFQPETNQDIALESKRTLSAQTSRTALPTALARTVLSPAMGDPFATAVPAPSATTLLVETPSLLPSHPPVATPPLNLRFVGRVTQANGKELIYMAYEDSVLSLTEGQSLPNGYKVDSVTQTNLRFSHPQLEDQVQLDLPALPAFQIR